MIYVVTTQCQDDHMTVRRPDRVWCLSHVSLRLGLGGTRGKIDSTKAGDCSSCLLWAEGLKKSGLYYDGFIDDIELVLEQRHKETVTFYGTRNSS